MASFKWIFEAHPDREDPWQMYNIRIESLKGAKTSITEIWMATVVHDEMCCATINKTQTKSYTINIRGQTITI